MRAAPSFADGASIRLMHTTEKRCLPFCEAKAALRGEKRTPQSIIPLWGVRQALLTVGATAELFALIDGLP
jgi:hypothetical protein